MQKGFTLIEILVVLVLMALVVGITVPNINTYNNTETLQSAELGVVSSLQQAKSQAESQVKPTSCLASQSLDGYRVDFTSSTQYQLEDMCSGSPAVVSSATLPTNILFTFSSYPQTFFFRTLQGGVTYTTNTIRVKDQVTDAQQIITVDQLGNITY